MIAPTLHELAQVLKAQNLVLYSKEKKKLSKQHFETAMSVSESVMHKDAPECNSPTWWKRLMRRCPWRRMIPSWGTSCDGIGKKEKKRKIGLDKCVYRKWQRTTHETSKEEEERYSLLECCLIHLTQFQWHLAKNEQRLRRQLQIPSLQHILHGKSVTESRRRKQTARVWNTTQQRFWGLMLTSPSRSFSRVDLPAPLGPTNATRVSRSIPNSRSL